jgi:hypothetical protein
MPELGLATSTSLSETACIKLGLVNKYDEDEMETSVDNEFMAYITAKHTPLNKLLLHFWQVCKAVDHLWLYLIAAVGARAYPTHMVLTCYGLSANSGILCALQACIFF